MFKRTQKHRNRNKESDRACTGWTRRLLFSCKQIHARKETERKKAGREKQHAAPPPFLARDCYRDKALLVVDCGWRQREGMSGAGQNKESSSPSYPTTTIPLLLIKPTPPKHSMDAWGKPDDYYNLNQSFKATTQACSPAPDSLFWLGFYLVLVSSSSYISKNTQPHTCTHTCYHAQVEAFPSFYCCKKLPLSR